MRVLPVLTEIPDNPLTSSRTLFDQDICESAIKRSDFYESKEVIQLKRAPYWNINSRWILALHSLYARNRNFLTSLQFSTTAITADTVPRLEEAIDNGIIPDKDLDSVKACLNNLKEYEKVMSKVVLTIKDGALCSNFDIIQLLMNEARLSKMTTKQVDALTDQIEKIDVDFEEMYDILSEKRDLVTVLRHQNTFSERVRAQLHIAAKTPSEYKNMIGLTKQLADTVKGHNADRILREFNKFKGKFDAFIKIEDHLPDLLINCIEKSVCPTVSVFNKTFHWLVGKVAS